MTFPKSIFALLSEMLMIKDSYVFHLKGASDVTEGKNFKLGFLLSVLPL